MSMCVDDLEMISMGAGYPPTRRTIAGPYDCPMHEVPLSTVQVDTFAGWFEVLVCPAFDGTCSYSVSADAARIDKPADVQAAEEAAAKAADAEARAELAAQVEKLTGRRASVIGVQG